MMREKQELIKECLYYLLGNVCRSKLLLVDGNRVTFLDF